MSTKQEKKMTIMAALALVFNLGLNLILIPRYEHVGAASVTSLTELLLLCIAIVFVPRHLLPLGSIRIGIKAIVASLVMALAIWVLSIFHIFNIFMILPIAMLVYFGTTTLLSTIPREDIKALYSAIQRKAQQTPSAEENITVPEGVP
jgi:peptidoglycan biosynthesis protein MviN/MurJ (putative lipid II flippase)